MCNFLHLTKFEHKIFNLKKNTYNCYMEKDYLSVTEFAVAIKKTESTVRRYIYLKKIEAKTVGVNKTKVIPKKELEKIII